MTKIIIALETEERLALGELARIELRNEKEQARYILRRYLVENGFLAADDLAVPAAQKGAEWQTMA